MYSGLVSSFRMFFFYSECIILYKIQEGTNIHFQKVIRKLTECELYRPIDIYINR